MAETDRDIDTAEDYYHQALLSDPGHVSAWNNYGRLLEVHRGDYPGAQRAYEMALRINPRHEMALYNCGSMLQTLQQYDRAEACYKRFLRFCIPSKVHGAVLCNYGLLLEESRKDYDGAEAMYKEAMLLEPLDCFTMVNYASLLNEVRRDAQGASMLYERVMSISPGDTTALCSYGRMLHLTLGQHERAEAMFKVRNGDGDDDPSTLCFMMVPVVKAVVVMTLIQAYTFCHIHLPVSAVPLD